MCSLSHTASCKRLLSFLVLQWSFLCMPTMYSVKSQVDVMSRLEWAIKFTQANPFIFQIKTWGPGGTHKLTLSSEIAKDWIKITELAYSFSTRDLFHWIYPWLLLICQVVMVLDPKLLVNTLCTYISLDRSLIEKLMCCPREVGPTAFHSCTMKLFLLGGTLGSDLLCTRWLSPKGPRAPGIIRIPDVAATVDLGWCDCPSLPAKYVFSC